MPVLRTVEDILPLASLEKLFIHNPVWLGISGIVSHNLAYYYREKEEEHVLNLRRNRLGCSAGAARVGSIGLTMPLTIRLMNSGNVSTVSTYVSWIEDAYGHRHYFYFLTSFGRIIFNTTFSDLPMVPT